MSISVLVAFLIPVIKKYRCARHLHKKRKLKASDVSYFDSRFLGKTWSYPTRV